MRCLGALVVVSAGLGAACGGTVTTAQSGGSVSGSSSGSGAGGASTASSASSTASTAGAGGAVSPGCAAATEAIAKASSGQGSCTAVVRLDYTSLKILGFQLVCGPYAKPTEASARAAAQMETGNGQTGSSIAGATPADELVLMEAASDFGWGAAVSARTGRSVFGGTVVWSGVGDITYPKTWKPAADIGVGCGPPQGIPLPKARGFDLASGQPLSAAQVNAALAPVWATALPAGMAKVAYLFDAMVLAYPRSVGGSDPSTSEWIVAVNAGYLE